jgi:putative exosortase-associated protein (TIGR04073 family)
MKRALLIGLIFVMTLSLGCFEAYAQVEGTVTTYNTYRMDFFKSQRNATLAQPEAVTTDELYYRDSPVSKGSNGFINATTAWSDLPAEVAETTANDNILSGITFGVGKGLASGVTRTAAGIVDMLTFAIPPYDSPLADTEYKVNNPEKEGYKVNIFKW